MQSTGRGARRNGSQRQQWDDKRVGQDWTGLSPESQRAVEDRHEMDSAGCEGIGDAHRAEEISADGLGKQLYIIWF